MLVLLLSSHFAFITFISNTESKTKEVENEKDDDNEKEMTTTY